MLFRIPKRAPAIVVALGLFALAVGAHPTPLAAADDSDNSALSIDWAQPLPGTDYGDRQITSVDGSRVYVAVHDYPDVIEEYDTTTRQPAGLIAIPYASGAYDEHTWAMAASPRGQLYALDAVEPAAGGAGHCDLVRLDPAKGVATGRVTLPTANCSYNDLDKVLVSRDGTQLYALCDGETVVALDVATLKVAHSWSLRYGSDVSSFTGGLLGTWGSVGTYTNAAQFGVFDPSTGRVVRTFPARNPPLPQGVSARTVGVLPDGEHEVQITVPTAQPRDALSVSLVSLADGSATEVSRVPFVDPAGGAVMSSVISNDGTTLYVAQTWTREPVEIDAVNLLTGDVRRGSTLPTSLGTNLLAGSGSNVIAVNVLDNGNSVLYRYSSEPAGAPAALTASAQPKAAYLQIGKVATVDAGTWSAAPDSVAYQWYRDFKPIPGATGASLPITPQMEGGHVYVVVTASAVGHSDGVVATDLLRSGVAYGVLTAPTPTVTGAAKTGSLLTAHVGNWTSGTKLTYQWKAGGYDIPRATARTFAVTSAQEGSTITVEVTGRLAGYSDATVVSKPTAKVPVVAYHPTVRPALAGADRYATAIAISKDSYPKAGTAKTVFIASGENFPDALSAAPAAVKLGGPLLLTPHDRLPSAVANELKRLEPKRIVVVGGATAVSSAVASSLARIAPTTRVSGADRYATSLAVAKYAFGSTAVPSVYVATGAGFADALSAGARAGYLGAPVVLIPGAASKPSSQLISWMKHAHTTDLNIVGGAAAISWKMADALVRGIGQSSYTPYEGADRFDTDRQLMSINMVYDGVSTAYVASGRNFPDALAGAVAAGKAGVPLYLTERNCVPTATVQQMKSVGISTVKRLGGPSALGAGVARMQTCN